MKLKKKDENKAEIRAGGVATVSTLVNKTGSWRTFRPVVTDKCTGCSICIDFCPDACIELIDNPNKNSKSKKIVKIDYDYCKGCLICENICPFKAIASKKENEK